MSPTTSSTQQAQHAGHHRLAPFPSQQLFVLALCRICEPIAFMSIFPYVYYMILSFDITTDSREIAVYVGLVTSSFAFAEFSSGVIWGRLSDCVGRKPVLLAGLAGTAISMIVFGFAQNLYVALLGRALGGLLNGNMGVLQTTVAEIVTEKAHQPRAYSIMPFVWCLGSIIGPALGGALAQPCESFPTFFASGTIFDRFPFLLPNLICAFILVVGVIIGILFLEETHAVKKHRLDRGIKAGQWLLNMVRPSMKESRATSSKDEKVTAEDRELIQTLLGGESLPEYSLADSADPPGYCTREDTPRQSSSRGQSPAAHKVEALLDSSTRSSRGVQKAFTKQVVLVIIAFGILAYHSISFDQLMPVFLSEPVSNIPPSLPFQFSGGFGYTTKKIGFMLSIQGIYSMFAQLFIFPFAARRFGTLKTFRAVIMVWPILYFLVPYVVLLPEPFRQIAIYLALLTKITLHVLAFPSTAILLANAAPSMLVLGAINGVSASTASLARACGPTFTGLLHSWGLGLGSTGIAWWASGLICAIGAIESLWLEETEDPKTRNREEDPTGIEEALLASDINDDSPNTPELRHIDSKISIVEMREL